MKDTIKIIKIKKKKSLETLSKLSPTVTLNQTTVSQSQTAIFQV